MNNEDLQMIELNFRQIVEPVFLEMLKASEERINTTNDMVKKLADAASMLSIMCDNQLNSATKSKDLALSNNTDLIQANIELTKTMDKLRDNYINIISGLREQLHAAKQLHDTYEQRNQELQKKCNRLQDKLDRTQEKYYALVDKYDRLAEKSISSGSSNANIKVTV